MILRRLFIRRVAVALLTTPVVIATLSATPAYAQFGGIVFDPHNYAQNVMTAARELQQINNQIKQLQNQAQSLINEAHNLASLPFSALAQIQQSIQQTEQLLKQAQNIAYNVQAVDQAFKTQYTTIPFSASNAQLVAGAKSRWQNTVVGLQDAMRTQATVVGNLDTNRIQTAALVGASQGAAGALQATQAGNQLLALQAQQLADLTAVIAANGRAQALRDAEQATAAQQGAVQRQQFLALGTGYQPGNPLMFATGN